MRLTIALVIFLALAAACSPSDNSAASQDESSIVEDGPEIATASSTTSTSVAPTQTRPPLPDGLREEGLRVYIVKSQSLSARPDRAEDAQVQLLIDQTPLFTEQTGIPIEYWLVDNQALINYDCGYEGCVDVALMDLVFIPLQASFDWWLSLESLATGDPRWDEDDLMPSVRTAVSYEDELYGAPLTANSSLLIYRTDLLAESGLTISTDPSWEEVSDIARTLAAADNGAQGICLQTEPGPSSLGPAFLSILNTFGGTYWTAGPDGKIGTSQIDQPEFNEAANFYIDLMLDAGPEEPLDLRFDDCLGLYQRGEVAMWFDSTAAGPLVEADNSPVRGLNGYSQTPTEQTESAGWVEGRAFTIGPSAQNPNLSWEYIQWATSSATERVFASDSEARADFGVVWQSFDDDPVLRAAYGPSLEPAFESALRAPIGDPGTTPRPGTPAVQYVGAREYYDMSDQCTSELALALAGSQTIDSAIDSCHQYASKFNGGY